MSSAKVLVVEDDDDLRFALALRLRAVGYAVSEARDGDSAVRLATADPPDVVLLDLGLPECDGVSVLERLAEIPECSVIPVVVLTGRDPRLAVADVARFRISSLLIKPADNDRLAEALATALGAPAPPREPGSPTGEVSPDVAPGLPDEGPDRRRKVLVVEDDDDLRYALALRIQSLGHDVVEAGDGESAVTVAARELPDVVLLDLGLPGGDGVSVLKRYARSRPLRRTPVVVLTGRDPVRAAADVSPFHVWALLEKPADNARLAEALASAIHQQFSTAPVPSGS